MRFTIPGVDYITLTEKNLDDEKIQQIPKIHLIKLDFQKPSAELINKTIVIFKNTNRFIISNNIKIYNDLLKDKYKKYYIENIHGTQLISFFRKNNKIMLNLLNLCNEELDFITYENVFPDILKNCEVIQLDIILYKRLKPYFNEWSGNIILDNVQ